jgi:YVTN family beta-propeller protein
MEKPLIALQVLVLCVIVLVGLPMSAASAQSAHPITQPVFMCGSGLADSKRDKQSIFESVPSRPLAVSANGSLLFVLNAPADCLEIFTLRDQRLTLLSTVSVGVDPVAVAQRTDTELWVVNHISDSISIVDIGGRPRVTQTLQVGDAPWDVVFGDNGDGKAGTNRKNRAFISAAFRGQNHHQFQTRYLLQNRLDTAEGMPGEQIGRADLWVFDVAEGGGKSLAGIVNLFTDSIRSLAVSPDGRRVFATAFKSGNRTAVVPARFDDLIGEKWSSEGVGNPEPMLIVQQTLDKQWHDLLGRDWTPRLNFSIADNDVFVIAADSKLQLGTPDSPRFNRHAITAAVKDVGTILFNSAYDATQDRLIVSALDSNNLQPMTDRLKNRFVSNLLTVVDLAGDTPRVHKLRLDDPLFNQVKPAGMALPGALQVDAAGGEIVLASLGGNKLSRLTLRQSGDGALLPTVVQQQFLGKSADYTEAPVGGPIGVLALRDQQLLIVQTLFDNKLLMFDTSSETLQKTDEYALFNPEKPQISYGRQYLYDATLTSGNGASACASCHIFGGSDKLQWDLSETGPIEIVEVGYQEHPDRDIPDLRTDIRVIAFKQDPVLVKTGDHIKLGNLPVPVVYMGDKQGFGDALTSGRVDLKSPGLAYLEAGPLDPRLSKYKRITEGPAWLLIDTPFFHPLKGPMVTLPLYGIADSGAMHFRGDLQGLAPAPDNHCPPGETVEERAFKEFNTPCDGKSGTFEKLMGGSPLSEHDMDQLTRFAFALDYPPNPIRPLNNQVNKAGEEIFTNQKIGVDVTDVNYIIARAPLIFRCVECHTINRTVGQFGTSKRMYSAPALTLQDAKIPHLRFLYDRAGFFRGDYRYGNSYTKTTGMRNSVKRALYDNFGFFDSEFESMPRYLAMRPQLRYYDEMVHAIGYNHGAFFDSTMFATSAIWILNDKDPVRAEPETVARYENLYEYLMAFDTDRMPMYGQQFTFRSEDLAGIKAGSESGRAQLQRFKAYVDSIYSPEGHSGVQCNLNYQSVDARVAIIDTQNLDTSNDRQLADSLLSFTPELEPITFTCS